MKKTLLLAAAGLLSLAASAQTDVYTFAGETPTPVSELTENGLYFLYDTYVDNVGNQGDRRALRYVNASQSNKIYGTPVTTLIAGSEYNSTYIWKAIKDGSGWKFQNISDNLFIPSVSGNTSNAAVSENAGVYTLVPSESNNTMFRVKLGDTNYYWDGNAGDNRIMAIWENSSHEYQFYEATAIDITELTVNLVKGGSSVGTSIVPLYPGEEYTIPSEIGTLSEIVDGVATLTIADGITPVKLSSARRQTQWMSSGRTGLTRTAEGTTYDAAEWFFIEDVTGGHKIFSPVAGKYVGLGSNEQQVPFVEPANAATYTFEINQNGPSLIKGSNNLGFNLWNGEAGAGNVAAYAYSNAQGAIDASTFWFFVYDNATFEANLPYYYLNSTVSNNNFPYNDNARFTNNNPWYVAQQEAKDALAAAIAAGVDADEIAKMQALVDAAATAQFGVAGTSIANQISALNAGKDKLIELTAAQRDITVSFKKGDVTYSTITYKGQVPEFPETLGDYGDEDENGNVDFIFATDTQSFKLVNARYPGVWGTSNNTGLYHTANAGSTFANGEWYIMDSANKLFIPAQAKFVAQFNVDAQAGFADNYDAATAFTITHTQEGPVSLCGANDIYMNEHSGANAGNIGGWYKTQSSQSTTLDAGSHWFMVFDEAAYEANKTYYWGDNGTNGFSGGALTQTSQWYTAIQALKDKISEAETDGKIDSSLISEAQALVDQAMNVNFGQQGVNIGSMIDDMSLKTTALQTALGINEIGVDNAAAAAIYDLQGRRLAAPIKGINIIGGKKVLVK